MPSCAFSESNTLIKIGGGLGFLTAILGMCGAFAGLVNGARGRHLIPTCPDSERSLECLARTSRVPCRLYRPQRSTLRISAESMHPILRVARNSNESVALKCRSLARKSTLDVLRSLSCRQSYAGSDWSRGPPERGARAVFDIKTAAGVGGRRLTDRARGSRSSTRTQPSTKPGRSP